ncbi:MAG: acetate--CoA ligase family protein [Candidatus Acetothermia bacterium]|nr:acetate--CoA ligase family protein [Candidatus Acetothermia bacterium]
MRLYEHEAKRIFQKRGIPVPEQYGVIHSSEELESLAVGYPAMLKAQVLVGGRGKAGGIKRAENLREAEEQAKEIFGPRINGYPVEAILLEEALEGRAACYIGATMDPATFNNVVLVSASGGVDIEEVARARPEAIHRLELIENEPELGPGQAQELAEKLARDLGNAALARELAGIISRLYSLYQAIDAKVCEINPLLLTPEGPIAADAKIVLDDNALFRQAKLLEGLGISGRRHDVAEPTPNERRAQAAGFKYVDLLPPDEPKEPGKIYVGLVPGGAGYGIFSIDEVANIGERFFGGKVVPFNFMDSGGGPTQEQMAEMFHLLMDDPRVDLIITSRFGGISSCDIFIRGLVQALRERHAQGKRVVPVYGRMVGTDLPSARDYLEKAKEETPEALKEMEIIVGNQKIMAEVIKEGLSRALASRRE